MTKQTMFICHSQTPVLRLLSLMSLSISIKYVGKIPSKGKFINYRNRNGCSKLLLYTLFFLTIVNQIILRIVKVDNLSIQ